MIKRVKDINKYPYHIYKQNKIFSINKPLVWGCAIGYSWEKMRIFILSLRKNGYVGDIVLITYNNSIRLNDIFYQYNIKSVLVNNKWPYYSPKNDLFFINNTFLKMCSIKNKMYSNKWATYRYSILYCWLLIYGKQYSHIFSLDVRDIVFQGNPYEWNFLDGIYIVDETKTNKILLKNSKYNYLWLKHFTNFTKILNNKILNGGTIFGTIKYFIPFMKQFCKCMNDNYHYQTNDQGYLNYAYYTGYFKNIKFYMNKNQKGVILTTGFDLPEVKLLKLENYTIYNEDGSIPLIIHQYDRYKYYKNMIVNKYSRYI